MLTRLKGNDVVIETTGRSRATAVFVGAMVFAFIAAACNSTDSSSSEPAGSKTPEPAGEPQSEPADSAPYEVLITTETFVDTSRATAEGATTPPRPERTVETIVSSPAVGGSFPLIVLSHGQTGRPERLTELAASWARAGYIVAAPAFPLTNGKAADGSDNIGDVTNQPGDVSFVIDSILAANDDEDSPLFERVDAERIGAAGHSLGGATTYGVTFAPCCVDERVDAAVILSGFRGVESGEELFDRAIPTLVLHGTADSALPFQLAVDAYAALEAPKWFVTLVDADHVTPYENSEGAWDVVAETTTTDFWNGTLGAESDKARQAAFDQLLADADVAGVATVEVDRG